MLRTLSLTLAVAAILAIPFSQADARSHGGHSMGRIGHVGHVGFTGHRVGFVGHRAFIARRHFVRGPFFVAGPTCWRWVPTAFGWRRLWVCDPYPFY